jgi:hypothetical protein
MVGPGAYKQATRTVGGSRVRGTHIYKGFHKEKEVESNGYYMVGSHMIYDATFD